MAAVDFPASPTDGQVFTANGTVYVYSTTLGLWQVQTVAVPKATISTSAPSGGSDGDVWYQVT